MAASAGERGDVKGSFQSAAAIARVAGPLAAGWLYDRTQGGGPFWLAAGLFAAVVWMGRSLPARVGEVAGAEAGFETPS